MDCIERDSAWWARRDAEVERICIEKWGAEHWADLDEDKKRDQRWFADADLLGQEGSQ